MSHKNSSRNRSPRYGERSRNERCGSSRRYVYDNDSNSASSDSDAAAADVSKQETVNVFKNDGSFLEMFKKAQSASASSDSNSLPVRLDEAQRQWHSHVDKAESSNQDSLSKQKPKNFGFVGKRRGGKILPTGKVKKTKQEDEDDSGTKKDAWSQYLSEVKKYRGQSCQEEGAVRPLVK